MGRGSHTQSYSAKKRIQNKNVFEAKVWMTSGYRVNPPARYVCMCVRVCMYVCLHVWNVCKYVCLELTCVYVCRRVLCVWMYACMYMH